MISVAAASKLYENCGVLATRRVTVEDPSLQSIFVLVRELHSRLGEAGVEEAQRFKPLFRLQWWLTRAPLRVSDNGQSMGDVEVCLRENLARLRLMRPGAAQVTEQLIHEVQKVKQADSSPLREAFLTTVRGHPARVVLLLREQMVEIVRRDLATEGLQNLVISPKGGSRLPFAGEGVLVGPVDGYPAHLFLSPSIPLLHCVAHSWKSVEPPQPRLPSPVGACTALAAGSARRSMDTFKSTIDIDLLLSRLKHEEMDQSETRYAREKVDARLVRLAGDHFMFIEAGGGVRTFQLSGGPPGTSQDGGEAFKQSYVEVEDLEPGMHILERTRGATPALEAVAESLMKDEGDMERLQASQAYWKAALRLLIEDLGLPELSKLLVDSGCVSARPYLLVNWTRSDTILPGEDECLRKILTLAGRSEPEIEAALRAGHEHRSMRIKAGMRISTLLSERLPGAVDRDELKLTGLAEVSLDPEPGAPTMKMLRVEGVDSLVPVMRGQLRIVYSGLSDAEPA